MAAVTAAAHSGGDAAVDGRDFFRQFARVHLIGIGGAGMEGLGRILLELGCAVSGSDREDSPVLEGLRQGGVAAQLGHAAANVHGADLVVFSAAIPADNVERAAARQLGIQSLVLAHAVSRLLRGAATVAVAGTHGKTTSASMLATVLSAAGADPSVLVGGAVGGRVQARLGTGGVFVHEADEFDRRFLHLEPEIALVNNIEPEHLDTYGDLDGLRLGFGQFLANTRAEGYAIVNGDDPEVERLVAAPGYETPTLRFGTGAHSDYRAAEIELRERGSTFVLCHHGDALGTIELGVPGSHNVLNATGVAAAALCLNTPFAAVCRGLGEFAGVDRRLQIKGEVDGVLVIDDYSHHPTEVRAALAAVRRHGRRVVAVFQPHLYSRTRDFHREFAAALSASDTVLLAAVYGSRETPDAGVDSHVIAAAMVEGGCTDVEFIPEREELLARVSQVSRPGDLVLTMGAGDIGSLADDLIARGGTT